jgi:AraC-like DNA-binding protein
MYRREDDFVVTLDQAGWLGPRAKVERAPSSIAAYVDHVFTLDFRAADQVGWRVLPDTQAHVLVHRGSGRGGRAELRASVVGSRNVAVDVDVSDRLWTVGVRLGPGALPELVGVPASELTDRGVGFEELWGRQGQELIEWLSQVTGPAAARTRLLSYLSRRLSDAREPDWKARAFGHAVYTSGMSDVGTIAGRMGVAPRTLRAQAGALLGLTPKRFTRIARVFAALRSMLDTSGTDPSRRSWSRVAHGCGFADHPHLVREFQSLLGETPKTFLARREPMPIPSSRAPSSEPMVP